MSECDKCRHFNPSGMLSGPEGCVEECEQNHERFRQVRVSDEDCPHFKPHGSTAPTCSLCGGMGELEGFAGVGRMPCHRCKQFAAEGGTDGRILESRRPLPSVATNHQKENPTGQAPEG